MQNKLLNKIVYHIPELVKQGPLAEVEEKVTHPLEEMVEKLKLVEANLEEYQEIYPDGQRLLSVSHVTLSQLQYST